MSYEPYLVTSSEGMPPAGSAPRVALPCQAGPFYRILSRLLKMVLSHGARLPHRTFSTWLQTVWRCRTSLHLVQEGAWASLSLEFARWESGTCPVPLTTNPAWFSQEPLVRTHAIVGSRHCSDLAGASCPRMENGSGEWRWWDVFPPARHPSLSKWFSWRLSFGICSVLNMSVHIHMLKP